MTSSLSSIPSHRGDIRGGQPHQLQADGPRDVWVSASDDGTTRFAAETIAMRKLAGQLGKLAGKVAGKIGEKLAEAGEAAAGILGGPQPELIPIPVRRPGSDGRRGHYGERNW